MAKKPNDHPCLIGGGESRPSFFKVLIDDDFSNHLRIPPQFLRHLGSNLNNEFVLSNRWRKCGNVCAEKRKETLYFNKGWGDFVRDNALKIGDFLVFFYTGNSNFNVMVYGKNCCEKIPVIANTTNKSQINQNEEKSLEETQPSRDGVEIIKVDSDDDFDQKEAKSHRRRHLRRDPNQGKSNAVEAANKFASKNPYFKVLMPHAYVQKSYMSIPKEFSAKYLDKKMKSIMLLVSEKSWHVKLAGVRKALRLSQGWRTFVDDNRIQIGDICIFEKIGGALHVTVCRD